LAFANMLDYMRVGFNGDPVLNFEGLTREQAAALREVIVESYIERDPDGEEGDTRVVKRVKFKLYDKRAALIDLKRHFHQYAGDAARATGAGIKPGKKELATAAARTAGEGTEWGSDLEAPTSSSVN
jgi:phage terminase small subunit